MRLPAPHALEKIQKGIVAPGYLLLGTELYWRDQICAALQKAMGLEAVSFGLAEFDLRQDSLEKAVEKAQSQNLLAPRQLLFIRNAQAALSRRGREVDGSGGGGETSPKHLGDLAAYFENPNPSTTLIFEMMDVGLETDDWREKEKINARLESFEELCDIILLLAPGTREAVALAQSEAQKRGRKISPQTAEHLVDAFHCNLALIRMELEKLCLRHPEKEWIDAQDLKEMISADVAGTGIELSEAIGSKNVTVALKALQGLRSQGKYAPLIVSEVARYLRQLILLKENRVRDIRQAGRVLWEAKLSSPQNSLAELLVQAAQFSGPQLLRGLELAFEADLALRSSPADERVVLERFLLALMGTPSRRD